MPSEPRCVEATMRSKTDVLACAGDRLGFVAVAVFGVVTYHNTVAVRQGEALVAHSYAVRETTRELLSSVKDMETGQRGFLITGAPAYLEPYHAGLEDVEEEFARLEANAGASGSATPPGQIAAAGRRQTGDACGSNRERRRAGPAGFDKAREIVMAGHGKSLMDDMRRLSAKCWRKNEGCSPNGRQRQSRGPRSLSVSSSLAT